MVSGPGRQYGVLPDYRRIVLPSVETKKWPRLDGYGPDSRDAGENLMLPGIRRSWKYAACLAVGSYLEETLKDRYGDLNVRPAVARITMGGSVMAGLLPPGVDFGRHESFVGNGEKRTVLHRIGPPGITEVAAMGYLANGRILAFPENVEVVDHGIRVDRESYWRDQVGSPVV